MDELVLRNYSDGNLYFTTDIAGAVQKTDVLFIAVGTPPGEDGSADLRYVLQAAEKLAEI